MRLYESLSYINNNNNNNNNHANDNNNIDRGCHSNGNTRVKTFTSNGNHQSNNDSVIVTAPKTASTTTSAFFECSDSIGNDVLNSTQNWQLETEFSKALAALNETYCFYGSQRKLKSRENLAANDDDDDNANGNGNGNHVNCIEVSALQSTKDTIDLIDDSSSDIEAEINQLINRSNLYRQNFECESNKINAPNTEEQFMDEEGK